MATTWTQTSDTAITAAIAAVGAGQALTDNWIDLLGNTWASQALASDTASGSYYLTPITSPSTPWVGNMLYRPAAEAGKTQRIVAQQRVSSVQTLYYGLRANRSTTGSTFNGFLVGVDHGSSGFNIHAFATVNGAANSSTQIVAQNLTTQPADGALVNIDISVTQVTDTTSQLTVNVTDTSGNVLGTFDSGTTNAKVNVAALQNVSGSVGVCSYSSSGNAGKAGIKEIKVSNGDSTPATATKYTLDGNTAVYVGNVGNYTATADNPVAQDVAITLKSSVAGTWTNNPVTIKAGSTVSSQASFAPSAAGNASISGTNNGGLADGPALAVSVTNPVVAPTKIVPSLSTNSADIGTTVKVTYTLDQPATVPVVFSPWSSANMGTWAASSATIPVGSTSTEIDYKPTTAGTVTLGSVVSSGGVSPSNVSLTITTPVVPGANIPVSNPAFMFSPGNWYGDTGRSGSSWRRTWNVGAYFIFTFNAGASPTASIDTTGSGSSGRITVYVNGIAYTLSTGGIVNISGLIANTQNILFVIFDSTPQSARWNKGGNNLVVNGVTLDAGSSPGVSVAGNKGWIQIVGDSITEGIEANGGSPQLTCCYTFSVLMALRAKGYEVSVSACGYSGYLVPGDSTKDVPPYFPISGTTRWGLIDQGISQLDGAGHLSAYGDTGTEPVGIAVNYLTNEALGTNGGPWSTSDSQTAMFNAMVANRKAAPNAWLFMIVPFGFHYSSKYPAQWLACFNAAMAQYAAAYPNDKKVVAIDIGADTSIMIQSNLNWLINKDDVHPLALGHALVGPVISGAMLAAYEGKVAKSFIYMPIA